MTLNDYFVIPGKISLRISAVDAGLNEVAFVHSGSKTLQKPSDPAISPSFKRKAGRHLEEAKEQLAQFFEGARQELSLPMVYTGTPFQIKVWKALLEIPFGTTVSYGELARRVRFPKAARAVGAACGQNPIALFIPCHRVIAKDGSLTGFGGGLSLKKKLLLFEKEHSQAQV